MTQYTIQLFSNFDGILREKLNLQKFQISIEKILFLDLNFLKTSKILKKNILQVLSRLIAFSNLTKRNYVTLRNFNRSIRTVDGV